MRKHVGITLKAGRMTGAAAVVAAAAKAYSLNLDAENFI